MTRWNRNALLGLAAAIGIVMGPDALGESVYQKPSQEVLDVLHAPAPPLAAISPTRDWMILMSPVRYPPIADLAQPMLRLGGVRVIARNHGIHGERHGSAYVMTSVADGSQLEIALPAGAKVSFPTWSADGRRYAFTNLTPDAVELWVGDAGSAKVRRIEGVELNPVLEDVLQWMPDQKTLLVKTVPKELGAPPPEPRRRRVRPSRRRPARRAPAAPTRSATCSRTATTRSSSTITRPRSWRSWTSTAARSRTWVRPRGTPPSPLRRTASTSSSRRSTGRTRTSRLTIASRAKSRSGTGPARWCTRSPRCRWPTRFRSGACPPARASSNGGRPSPPPSSGPRRLTAATGRRRCRIATGS